MGIRVSLWGIRHKDRQQTIDNKQLLFVSSLCSFVSSWFKSSLPLSPSMFKQIISRLRQWLSGIGRKFSNWINPPLPPGYNPPRLPDYECEWLFKQLLKGVGQGWTKDQVLRWLRRNERRVTENRWLEWFPRFEDTAR